MEILSKIYNHWCKIDDKIRFVIIGCLNAGISYIIFILAILVFGEIHHQLCVTLQWAISSVFSYLNQKFFVFCTKGNYIKEYLKCCFSWFISYCLNLIILEVLLRYFIKNVYISQFISLFVVAAATYTLFKLFAFNVKK